MLAKNTNNGKIFSWSLIIVAVALVLSAPFIIAAGLFSNTGGVEITINKSDSPDPVNVSQNLTYTITVNISNLNQSITNVSNLTVTDIYPAQVVFLTSQPTALAGTNDTFILGNFTANQTVQINITVRVRSNTFDGMLDSALVNGTIINNSVNLSFQNSTSFNINISQANETTTITNLNTNLSVKKTVNANPGNASYPLNFTINVTNNGGAVVFNVTVNDTYPDTVFFLGSEPAALAGTNNTFILGNLSPGISRLINISVMVRNVSNTTQINNTANVTFQNGTSNTLSILVTNISTVLGKVVNTTTLTVAKKSTTSSILVGTQLNYTISINNTGNATAYNVTVNETYQAGLIFDSAQPTPSTGNTTFIVGNLTAGGNFTINITLNVTNIFGHNAIINNTANITYQNESSGNYSIIVNATTTALNPPPGGGSTSGGGGGGGGASAGHSYSMTGTSASFALHKKDKVTFIIKGVQHSITVSDLVSFHVDLLVQSASQTVRINKGDTQEVDVDGDGRKDVRITVLGLTSFDVSLKVELLSAACVENWSCAAWTACKDGKQTRGCTDQNACGTTALKPVTSQGCTVTVPAEVPPAVPPAETLPEATPEVPPSVPLPAPKSFPLEYVFYGIALIALVGLGAYWYFSRRE